MSSKELVIWGGTGQAKVLRSIIEDQGYKIVAVFDDTPDLSSPFTDVPIYQGKEGFVSWLDNRESNSELSFVVAIGNPHGKVRIELSEFLKDKGLIPVTLIHKSAVVSPSAQIGEGCQIQAGTVIEAHAKIGNYCIINTKSSVDHECILSEGVELSPGVTLCGCIEIGRYSWVCVGSSIAPRVKIGENATIAGGSMLLTDVKDNEFYAGVPAIKKNKN